MLANSCHIDAPGPQHTLPLTDTSSKRLVEDDASILVMPMLCVAQIHVIVVNLQVGRTTTLYTNRARGYTNPRDCHQNSTSYLQKCDV